ncbi:hypothetical protein vBSAP01_228 [Staphylococcus phage vB_SAP01]|nr:hypothetical protein vBSAP01_228 [Staphylococcus phage vB_SAP01]
MEWFKVEKGLDQEQADFCNHIGELLQNPEYRYVDKNIIGHCISCLSVLHRSGLDINELAKKSDELFSNIVDEQDDINN